MVGGSGPLPAGVRKKRADGGQSQGAWALGGSRAEGRGQAQTPAGLAPRAPPRGLRLCAVEGGCGAVSVAVCEPARGWAYARARLGVYVRSLVRCVWGGR